MATVSGRRVVHTGMLLGGLLLGASCTPHGRAASAPASVPTNDRQAGRSEQHAPISTLSAKTFRYRFAIYMARAPAHLQQALEEVAKKSSLRVTTQVIPLVPVPAETTIFVSDPPIESFAPPPMAELEYFSKGLNDAEKQQLVASRAVLIFEVTGPGQRALEDYRAALSFGRELAGRLGGFLWDEEARLAFTQASFQPRIDSWQGSVPFVNYHVVLHEYREGELLRIVSLGMVKFGLPDVAIDEVASTDANRAGKLIDLVLQRLIEGAVPDERGQFRASLDDVRQAEAKAWFGEDVLDNANRSVVLLLAPTKPAKGDADNRLLAIQFPGDAGRLQERQAATLDALFGSSSTIVYLEHDAELLAVSARARKRAFGLRARFANGPPFGEVLLVKSPFATPKNGREWIWVEVVKWQNDTISGVLTEGAFDIPGLKEGARVDVKASEIFDYMLVKKDGTREGNETEPLLEARAHRREKR